MIKILRLILISFLIIHFPVKAHEINKQFYIFSGTTSKKFADDLAYNLRTPLSNINIVHFTDGEIKIKVVENVKNKNVFIVQTIAQGNGNNINDSVMELYLMAKALKQHGVASITAIIPFFGYIRENHKYLDSISTSSIHVARLLETAGIEKIITIDLPYHNMGDLFIQTTVENISPSDIFAPYFTHAKLNNPVILALHSYGILRAENLKEQLANYKINANLALGIITKKNNKINMNIIGKVKDQDVIISDNTCDSGITLLKTAETLKNAGAKKIYAVISHPILIGDAITNLASTDMEIIILDTILVEKKLPPNIKKLSTINKITEVMKEINGNL